MATLSVGTADDIVDGDVSSISALLDASGRDRRISLREAILATNATAGPDTIDFSSWLDGVPIILQIAGVDENGSVTGDLDITDDLTITGRGAANTIIDGGRIDRVIDIHSAAVTISGMTIRGGSVSGEVNFENKKAGGGIRVGRSATLSLSQSTISGNSAQGGGGIFVDNDGVMDTIADSTISRNSANGVFDGNSINGLGGGISIYGGEIDSISNSTISGNSAERSGGGIHAYESRIGSIFNSTISGNSAEEGGGGIVIFEGTIGSISNSTISGNSAEESGGGILIGADGDIGIISSTTVFGNSAGENGGGLVIQEDSDDDEDDGRLGGLFNSIIAGNIGANLFNGLVFQGGYLGAARNNLIGDASGHPITNGVDGNIVGVDPLLGPLQDNGGPTFTHALLLGSSTIDAGINPDNIEFDQRGEPFFRVFGDAPDIGAVEEQPAQMPRVFVNSSRWDEAFREMIGATGSAQIGHEDSLISLPWSRLDQISITFDRPASMTAGDLELFGVRQESYTFDAASFRLAADGRIATWVLDNASHPNGIEADRLRVVLDDVAFQFDILPGDGNHDGRVDIRDVQYLRSVLLSGGSDATYQADLDFNGSGSIDLRDVQILRANLGQMLPEQLPPPVMASLPRLEDLEPLVITRRADRQDRVFHTLLSDSSAIDAGSNPDDVEFDQRGEPFARVLGNSPDIGEAEFQDITPNYQNSVEPFDVDSNEVVNALDLVHLIRDIDEHGYRTLSSPTEPTSLFVDVNGDDIVNPLDLIILIRELNRMKVERESPPALVRLSPFENSQPDLIPSADRHDQVFATLDDEFVFARHSIFDDE